MSDDLLGPSRVAGMDEVQAALCAASLRDFVPMVWPLVERKAYKGGWHIDAICDHLEAVSKGQLRKLAINVPPRHSKSTIVSVIWPCWEWLRSPETQWLYVSYAQGLSKRDSLRCRRIIESQGGRKADGTLPERVGYRGLLRLLGADWRLASDQNEKMRFENTESGYRLATSIDGTATGEGGDRIVLDDPHKAKEVESEVERDNVIEFIDGTLSTRHNDPVKGSTTLIMQRLHENDATGHLLAQGGYTHLCLPAEYQPSHPFVWPNDPRTEPGELLWPAHFPQEEIDDLKRALGSYRAAGQLQQLPAPAEGGIFKTAWWRYYDPALLVTLDRLAEDPGVQNPGRMCGLPHFVRLWQSWDTAMKAKTTSDYTVGQLWAAFGPNAYLLRQVRGRWGLHDVVSEATKMTEWAARRFPGLTPTVLVENTAIGPEVIVALRSRVRGIVPVNPSRDKSVRAAAITPQMEGGNVWVPGVPKETQDGRRPGPGTPAWVQALIAECASFPNGANDDQVDALTQALDPRRMTSNDRSRSMRSGTVEPSGGGEAEVMDRMRIRTRRTRHGGGRFRGGV